MFMTKILKFREKIFIIAFYDNIIQLYMKSTKEKEGCFSKKYACQTTGATITKGKQKRPSNDGRNDNEREAKTLVKRLVHP